MYKKNLIAIAPDHTDAIDESVAAARALADRGVELHVLSVLNVVPYYMATEIPTRVYESACAEIQSSLEKSFADVDDIRVSTEVGEAPASIVSKAKDGGYDLVVIRSHKPGLKDWFLGSTAGRVVSSAPCAVHVLR